MRLGLVLDSPAGPGLLAEARVADRFGLDLVWIPELDRTGGSRSSTVVAASLAPHAGSVRVVVEVGAARHPIELAEELAVTDQLLRGRLGVACADGAPGELGELLHVLRAGLRSRPFRHTGPRWSFPMPAEDGTQALILVTPSPAQLEFPIWLVGPTLLELSLDRGLTVVAHEDDDLSTMRRHWQNVDAISGHAAGRHPRVALRTFALPTSLDGDVGFAVSQLEAERVAWGMDTAVVRLSADLSTSERLEAIEVLATRVRPRVQGIDLPPELVESWTTPPSTDSEPRQS
jgi:alkanesulfonate monooxygenase SsuD/methylene tetrahydromethanopterin reductase-like flavin-dependent oxidoreductase (luciferase family)